MISRVEVVVSKKQKAKECIQLTEFQQYSSQRFSNILRALRKAATTDAALMTGPDAALRSSLVPQEPLGEGIPFVTDVADNNLPVPIFAGSLNVIW